MTPPLGKTRLSVGTILLVVFILVSAGPFGVEELVVGAGPGMALLLLLVVPVVWGIPLALLCTELASAIPDEGGAYVWVERGLGRFWAFQSGWWGTISGLIDTAIYAVLAAGYANSWLGQPPVVRWLMALLVIAVFTVTNLRGLRSMALSSATFAVVILAPCTLLALLGVVEWQQNPFVPLLHPERSTAAGLGAGLTVAIWFYSGYESMSTMAGEVAEPARVIPRALLLSLPLVIAVYFLPTAAALASVGRWDEWDPETGMTLVQIAGVLGGPLLAGAMMAGALASSLGLYNAYLASGARTTFVMAERGVLPAVFARVHPRFGTPSGSILIAAAIHAVLAFGSIEVLLVVDVLLFVMNYLLVFIAAVALRVKEPALARPFRVPVGTAGLVGVAALPTAVALAFLFANGLEALAIGSLALLTGPPAYALLARSRSVRQVTPADGGSP